ncbi:MAG: NUDIX hydrolase [Sedimentisphaerales bacterium]|nr:NUDIX hydrolase [Sedimentisphaerales bacterium]
MSADKANHNDESLFQGNFLHMRQRGRWEYVHRMNISGIVVIVAVTDQQELVLTEQFRLPVDSNVIELPAGLAGDIEGQEHEPLSEAAKRELLEETGYEAANMEFLTEGPPSPGMTSEIVTFFLATGLKRVHEGGGDHTEDIITHTVPLAEIHQWLEDVQKRGVLLDPKTYAGVYFALKAIS